MLCCLMQDIFFFFTEIQTNYATLCLLATYIIQACLKIQHCPFKTKLRGNIGWMRLMVEKLTFNFLATALVDIPAVTIPIARSKALCCVTKPHILE